MNAPRGRIAREIGRSFLGLLALSFRMGESQVLSGSYMTAGLPNSEQDNTDDLSASDPDLEGVENFIFEATAGVRTDAAHEKGEVAPRLARIANSNPPGNDSNAKESATSSPASARQGKRGVTTNSSIQPAVPEAALAEATLTQSKVINKAKRHSRKATAYENSLNPASRYALKERKSGAKKRRRSAPPWAVSLGIHAAILSVLSLFTLATLEPDEFLVWSNAPVMDDVEEFQELEIESQLDLEELETELPTELEDAGMAALGDVSADSVFSEISHSGPLSGESIGEWGSMFGDQGSGLADLGLGEGNALTEFFGTKSKARNVVFVIDNTSSMASGGLETVIVEMMKTVESLDSKQRFYVYFFSDQVYPLFYPQPVSTLIRPTAANKKSLRRWLDTVEFCTGGVWQLTQALEAAYKLDPDVVYLLTDGRHWGAVRADYKVEAVKNLRSTANPQGIPVHTLGMGCQTDFDRENLAQVAEANSGTFREVAVSPAMVRVAETMNRPKHDYNTGPGPVWGTLVPKRRN